MFQNTLFISDLDGTLLNSECRISNKTCEILNPLIENGLKFTIATARTSETVKFLTNGLNINIPTILMNGVALYDLQNKTFLSYEAFYNNVDNFFEIIKKSGSLGFLYIINGDSLETYYVNTNTPNAKSFMQERIKIYGKKFTQIADFSLCKNKSCVHYSVSDKKEKLLPIFEKLKDLNGFSVEFYRDIYNEYYWYLEVCSDKASKYNAAEKLKNMLGFEKLIAFGDNLNDLPLFKAADKCYAVSNAKIEIKSAADGIIDSNNENGVAKFIKRLLTQSSQENVFL